MSKREPSWPNRAKPIEVRWRPQMWAQIWPHKEAGLLLGMVRQIQSNDARMAQEWLRQHHVREK